MKGRLLVIILIILIISAIGFSNESNNDTTEEEVSSLNDYRFPRQSIHYIQNNSIIINSNSEFQAESVARGWIGNGLKNTPYIIENYRIDNTTPQECISISNTDV